MNKNTSTNKIFFALFSLLLVISIISSLMLGSVSIPLEKVLRILLGFTVEKQSWVTIVLQYRAPKVITALLAGSALAISGLMMQTLFHNPLADPYILGVSSGASLGVSIVVLGVGTTGSFLMAGIGLFGDLGIAAASFLGSLLILLFILLISRRAKTSTMMLLIGLMISYITSSFVSLLIYFSLPEKVQTYLSWTFGSFGGVTWSQIKIILPTLIAGFIIAIGLSKSLNALLLGENYAQTMGMSIKRTRLWIIISASLLTGIITAFCGPIGFLGIAIPHIARAVFKTADHKILIPASFLLGGIMAIISDIIAQMPGNQQVLPINVVTAVLGAPVVVWVLLRNQRKGMTA
jgi:iron complex transport system permease protein